MDKILGLIGRTFAVIAIIILASAILGGALFLIWNNGIAKLMIVTPIPYVECCIIYALSLIISGLFGIFFKKK